MFETKPQPRYPDDGRTEIAHRWANDTPKIATPAMTLLRRLGAGAVGAGAGAVASKKGRRGEGAVAGLGAGVLGGEAGYRLLKKFGPSYASRGKQLLKKWPAADNARVLSALRRYRTTGKMTKSDALLFARVAGPVAGGRAAAAGAGAAAASAGLAKMND